MSVTLKNGTGKELQVVIVNEEGEQDINNIAVGASVTLEDAIAAKSHGLYALVSAGKLVVTAGAMPAQDFTDAAVPASGATAAALALKATKDVAAVVADSAVTAVADAGAASGAYVQAELQAVVDLANDLKAKYNAAVALINELKGIVNNMNA